MKYDSSMAQFRKDIIAALRLMCGNNTEIIEKFSPGDGSPTPLRDYLKEKYRNMGVHSNGIGYWCTPSKGVEVYFSKPLNNDGDKNLTLSWSQTAKFIRDNWNEVFKKDKPKSRPLETLVKTFDEAEITCPNWLQGKTLTYLEAVNGVHFECKAFSMEFCKFDDITNFFVQHCHKPQECPYCKDSAESKPTYKDIFLEHYLNFDVSRFDEFINSNCRYACAAEYFTDTEPFDCNNPQNCKKCWYSPCENNWNSPDFVLEDIEDISDYLKTVTVPENESPEEIADKAAVSIQDKNTEMQAAFDYSELDGDTAKNLRDCETVIRQETAGYFTLMGAKFKEARELLANHANGTFEKWYTAMGFKRQTVYNLIQRYDFLGSPTIGGREDTFEALPLTLSYEVSKPDAPAELVEKVLDGDITTNAEYIKLKAELERTREECRQLDANSAAKDKEYERELKEANDRAETEKKAREAISQNLSNMEEGYREFKDKYADEYYKNKDLEKRVKELESRPVDVAVQDNSDLMEELEELREENARLKDDSVKSMVIRLTLDEYDKLLEKLGGDPCLGHIIKHAKIIKL